MKIFEYGAWTIAYNVNNVKLPYCFIYKGLVSPNPEDLERLGGSVYQIKNGKTVRAFKNKYDCDHWLEGTSITFNEFSSSSSISTFSTYGAGLSKYNVYMTAPHLDLKL